MKQRKIRKHFYDKPFKCKKCEKNMNTADSSVTPDIDKFEDWDKKKPFKCKKC